MARVQQYYVTIRQFIERYERLVSAAALTFGFVVDSFTLSRIDLWINQAILFSYLGIALVGIVLIAQIDASGSRSQFLRFVAAAAPLAVQFAFGGLFSGFVVYYSRSASIALSWLFVGVLVALMIANEAFTRQYLRFRYQMTLWFVGVLSFLVFYLPVVTGEIGPRMFYAAVAISVLVMALTLVLVGRLVPRRIDRAGRALVRNMGAIALVFILLYQWNVIPPLPLALSDAGVFHTLSRTTDGYSVTYEPRAWYQLWRTYNTVYHRTAGEPAYVYSAVFAPTRLDTTVVHEWQYYDETRGTWLMSDTFFFDISGGREGGYRVYSKKSALFPGKWRVDVKTSYGATIGRISFTVVAADVAPELERGIK